MSELVDTALRRVRNRMWRRVGKAIVLYAAICGFIMVFMAPAITALACVAIPCAIAALITACFHWTYHRQHAAVIAEASRISNGSLCPGCSYDLRGIAPINSTLRCPECGVMLLVRNDGELRKLSSTPRLTARGDCTQCSYSLRGVLRVDGFVRCPECGTVHDAWVKGT